MKEILLDVIQRAFSYEETDLVNFKSVIDKMNLPENGYVFNDLADDVFDCVDTILDLIRMDRRNGRRHYGNHWINDERAFNIYLKAFVWANIDNLGDYYPWSFSESQQKSLRRACDFLHESWNFVWNSKHWKRIMPDVKQRVILGEMALSTSSPALTVFLYSEVLLVYIIMNFDQSVHGDHPNLSLKEFYAMEHQNMIHVSRLLANSFREPRLTEDIPLLEYFRWGKSVNFEKHFKRTFALKEDDLKNKLLQDDIDDILGLDLD